MSKQQKDELEKDNFKGSSKVGNMGLPHNTGRQFKKLFK